MVLFDRSPEVVSSQQQGLESHQIATTFSVDHNGAASSWVEIDTVPVGKTFFCNTIVISTDAAAAIVRLGVGAAASEVAFMGATPATGADFVPYIQVPLKFEAGVRLAAYSTVAASTLFTLSGWLE